MRVLISGSGIAGPSLAWFLAKTGAKITIVEKSPALYPHGQNVDIQGSAVTAIKKMGLLDEVRRFHTREQGSRFIDSQGNHFAPFPVRSDCSASMTSEFEILRGDFAAILYNASKNHPNVDYLFGTTITNVISNNEDDAVKVELSNGATQEYDLLVAADGQWSKVRKQCFPKESVTVIDKGMYVVYYTIPRLPIDDDWWNIYIALRSRIITLRPDPQGTIRAMFTLMPCNEAQKEAWQRASRSDRDTQRKLLRNEFADAGWQAERLLDAMDAAPDFYFQAIQQIKMKKWSNHRVICLGDAAFAPTPLTGQGTSLAITGAYLLAGELSKLKDGQHPSLALEAYENAFRPFVEKVQQIPSFVPSIAHPESKTKRWMFQIMLTTISSAVAIVQKIPWLRSRFEGTNEANDDGFPLPNYPSLDNAEFVMSKEEK